MTARFDKALDDLASAMRQGWRDDAACIDARMPDGTAAEFVDVTSAETAEYLIRRWCYRCTAVGACHDEAERLAPHRWPTVQGARWWPGKAKSR